MKPKVYLAFLDECVGEVNRELLSYKTNKVGGKPNWIDHKEIPTSLCELCGLVLTLIVQIYGPLEMSQYHRTLYLFGCINPNCWNKKESWVCLRSQVLDNTMPNEVSEERKESIDNFNWCDGASVWEDEEDAKSVGADQTVINEDELSNKISVLNCNEVFPTEAKGEFMQAATAEIEDDSDEMITIDTPLAAQTDLVALMHQVTPMPQVSPEMLEFKSFFLSVIEEDLSETVDKSNFSMPQTMASLESNSEASSKTAGNNKELMEEYEKTVPLHGDKMFHRFISVIQRNPGQILRYIRDGGTPLFLYPADGLPQRCQHCNGELVFELQLLPTLVSSLQLVGGGNRQIEFGTVFVLSCKNSCWTPGDIFRSEYVYIQKELL